MAVVEMGLKYHMPMDMKQFIVICHMQRLKPVIMLMQGALLQNLVIQEIRLAHICIME